MQLGLQIPRFDWIGEPAIFAPQVAALARCVEDAGFASIWVMDHLLDDFDYLGEQVIPEISSF